MTHFQKLFEEGTSEFDFQWNAVPEAIGKFNFFFSPVFWFENIPAAYIFTQIRILNTANIPLVILNLYWIPKSAHELTQNAMICIIVAQSHTFP